MKLSIPNCPTCGQPAIGTLETVPGIALFEGLAPDGTTEYFGETKMLWDEQKTILEAEKPTLLCREGHDWQSEVNWSAAPGCG